MSQRKIPITFYDDQHIQCPKVGHDVAFDYCRAEQGDSPCRNLLSCWWDHIEVASFVAEHFGGSEAGDLFDGPAAHVASLADLMAQAQHSDPS
ncbi:MAG: hypothetical protein ACYTFO_02465 [Planctomycetota bacterium]|jgi:hypothetical protein